MFELHKKQKSLDADIIEKHNLKAVNLFNNKVIALDVELGECFNEIESFKHWKKNKGKTNVLEEACDALHFILSLANDCKHKLAKPTDCFKSPLNQNWVDYFLIDRKIIAIKKNLWTKFYVSKDPYILNIILRDLMTILNLLGYSWEDLKEAYYKKNKINFKRQEENY